MPSTSSADRTARSKSAQELRNSSTRCLLLQCLYAQPLEQDSISESQARFFLSLPDKLRRQHFNKEELQLLTQHSHEVLERSFQAEHAEVQSRNSASSVEIDGSFSGERTSTSASDVETEVDTALTAGSSEHLEHGNALLWRQENIDREAGISVFYTRRRASAATLNIAIPEPPRNRSTSPRTSSPAPTVPRKPKIRSLSLTPLSLPPPTLAPAPPLPSPSTLRSFVVSNKVSCPCTEFTTFLEPQAPESGKFGQDLAATQPLRALSSSQKPDKTHDRALPIDVLAPCSASTVGSFPIQGAESLHSHGTEEDGSVDTHGPATPPLSGLARLIKQSTSLEFDVGLASQPLMREKDIRDGRKHGSSAATSNCGISMHVTSMQPESKLEDQIYSFQRSQNSGVEVADADPLALDPLPVCDDPTGAHGAFALYELGHKKGLKRVLEIFRFR